ncbi:hypothetical protein T4D_5059 [Trichinella pseudospiralis]|uniref:Secreted protein n=1 Tax=Trichinella pseudospiralis TaxID=6337 RepID=A0A0V1FBF9_TRIPS|nr:hypothetical protein T4D_5059 [Trichinella pseudospiralis]
MDGLVQPTWGVIAILLLHLLQTRINIAELFTCLTVQNVQCKLAANQQARSIVACLFRSLGAALQKLVLNNTLPDSILSDQIQHEAKLPFVVAFIIVDNIKQSRLVNVKNATSN